MSNTMENVKTINSAVRTLMMLVIAGVLGYGGYTGYTEFIEPGIQAKQAMADLEEMKRVNQTQAQRLRESEEENDRLATINKLMRVEGRVANLQVLEKGVDEDGQDYLEVRFTEVDEGGYPIGTARDFTLAGDTFFIDCWVAKFEDKYIEQVDDLRGQSLVMFKSIFGNDQKPSEAFSLDDSSQRVPKRYQTERQSTFETKIWADFNTVCNDREKQKELGIRAIHGQANYLPPEEGRTYQVNLRSTGDVSLTPLARKDDQNQGGQDD